MYFRLPEMPTSFAGKIIMDGILENRRIFSVPNHFMFPVKLVRFVYFFQDLLRLTL